MMQSKESGFLKGMEAWGDPWLVGNERQKRAMQINFPSLCPSCTAESSPGKPVWLTDNTVPTRWTLLSRHGTRYEVVARAAGAHHIALLPTGPVHECWQLTAYSCRPLGKSGAPPQIWSLSPSSRHPMTGDWGNT